MEQVKTALRQAVTIMAFLGMLTLCSLTSYAAEPYVHDPMANPGAAKDIVVNPNAVYGYSPSPESARLKDYVEYDWTNPEVVEKMRQQREEYHESMKELYSMIAAMKERGASAEEIARAVSTRRNELRLESYKDDPEGLAKVKKSNLENYGDENGGSPEFFYNKYGSWETVIEKSISANAGADACLGLYDKYYDTYMIAAPEESADVAASGAAAADTAQPADTAAPADSSAQLTEYTVVAGDNLSSIAGQIYGDAKKWRVIYDLNTDRIKDPNLIYPGQVLKVH